MPRSAQENFQYNTFMTNYRGWKGKMTDKFKKNGNWIDVLVCDVYECDEEDEPLYTDEGLLGDSRIDNLEERLDDFNNSLDDLNNRLNLLEWRLGLIDGRGHGAIGPGAGGGKRRRKRKTRKRRKKKTKKMHKKRRKKTRKRRR